MVSLKHGGEWAAAIRAGGTEVFELRRRRRFELSRLLGLWRIIRSYRPVILVTWLYTADTYGRLLSLLAGVPHRISCHRSSSSGPFARPWPDKLLSRFTDCVVFNSRRSEEQARRSGIRMRTLTIPNAVEVAQADASAGRALLAQRNVPAGDALIGIVARLDANKDHDLFFAMASPLASRPGIHFLLIGDGPERSRLERLAHELGLQGRVTFLGHLQDPLPVVACLRAKVLTSHHEGMSNALMEAMALGVPCVVSAAAAEWVTDGVEGYVVREREGGAFAARVAELVDNPGRWEEMSAAARRSVERRPSVAAMVNAYEGLFDQILAGR